MAFLFGWLSMLVTDPGHHGLRRGWPGALRGVTWFRFLPGVLGPSQSPRSWVLAAVNIRAASTGIRRDPRAWRGSSSVFWDSLSLWGLGLGRGDWSNFVPLVEQRPGSDPLAGGSDRRHDRGLLFSGRLVGRQQARRRGPRPRTQSPEGLALGVDDSHVRVYR